MGLVGREDTFLPSFLRKPAIDQAQESGVPFVAERSRVPGARGCHQNRGVALVAVLLLFAVGSIVTATVLQTTSTEIQISGNHRQTVQEFYAAEAGLAEARSRLRKTTKTAAYFIGDTFEDPLWTAYVLDSSDWSPALDPEYAADRINVIPLPGHPTNTVVQPNSVQTGLSYWVKIRHKTEYDAEQAGHRSSTPHYLDLDGRTSLHSKGQQGHLVYFGYPQKTSVVPVSFTTKTSTPWLPIEKITAHGATTRGSVVLEEEVLHPPGPNQLGALHVSGVVNLTGTSGEINGHDACGRVGSLPPVVFGGTLTSVSTIQFNGTPASPQPGYQAPALDSVLATLDAEAMVLNADQINQQLGTVQVPVTFLAKAGSFVQPQGIRIRQTRGFGILLVEGNATLEGEVHWDGMILVTGTLFINGQGGDIVIRGGVWASRIDQQAGSLTVRYDSCRLQTALLAVPVQVRTWREVF